MLMTSFSKEVTFKKDSFLYEPGNTIRKVYYVVKGSF